MTQTFETSRNKAHNDTAPKIQKFMKEALEYGASFDSLACHDAEVDIELFSDGSFTISHEDTVLTTDDPRGYERTPAFDTTTSRHLSVIAFNTLPPLQLRSAS